LAAQRKHGNGRLSSPDSNITSLAAASSADTIGDTNKHLGPPRCLPPAFAAAGVAGRRMISGYCCAG
jgi:hypothetical protein